jgi:hypothetical protein
MKKTIVFLLLLMLLSGLFVVGQVYARDNWQQMREALHNMKLEMMIRQIQRTEEELKQLVNSCTPLDEAFASSVAAEVVRGRYITAFETCRGQGMSVDACIQKMQEIRRKWKERCGKVAGMGLVDYYYAKVMVLVEDVLNDLKNRRMAVLRGIEGSGFEMAALAGASQAIARLYPGSDFSLITGTGKIVTDTGVIYFQGWRFVQFDMRSEAGLVVQYFPNKINYTSGRYNIAFYLDPRTKEWEVVEVNLPFDAHTEKLLMSLGQGVRVSDREIIYMLNEFLHNTGWGLDLFTTSEELLLRSNTRRFIMESLFEYFAFDNYIAKVRAEEKRRSKPAAPQPTERKTGMTGQKQKKK